MTFSPPPRASSVKPPRESGKQRGFTLIELSIVLVIIGLIIGGVMVGRDLIEGAQIRSQISEIESYKAATNTFRLKYNCMAGDCANAISLGLSTNTGWGTGDGNDRLRNTWSWSQNLELYDFWKHLSSTGLIAGNYTGWTTTLAVQDQTTVVSDFGIYFPKAKIGATNAYVVAASAGTSTSFGATPTMDNSFVITTRASYASVLGYGPTLTAFQSKMLDDKIDNGEPTTGTVQIAYVFNYFVGIDIPNTGFSPCTTGTPRIYNVTNTTVACMPVIKF